MTMRVREACPECGSQHFKKKGHIYHGKQHHQGKDCGRQFVVAATNRVIVEEQRTMVERLLCEKISLHGICRAVGVSIRWLMDFLVACFAAVPDHFHGQPRAASRTVQFSEVQPCRDLSLLDGTCAYSVRIRNNDPATPLAGLVWSIVQADFLWRLQ